MGGLIYSPHWEPLGRHCDWCPSECRRRPWGQNGTPMFTSVFLLSWGMGRYWRENFTNGSRQFTSGTHLSFVILHQFFFSEVGLCVIKFCSQGILLLYKFKHVCAVRSSRSYSSNEVNSIVATSKKQLLNVSHLLECKLWPSGGVAQLSDVFSKNKRLPKPA